MAVNWRDPNALYKWRNELDEDHAYCWDVPTGDIDALLKNYIELMLECQKRGIIYG